MVRRILQSARRARSVLCVLVLLVPLGFGSHTTADIVLDPLRELLVRSVTKIVTRSFRGTLEWGALRGALLGSLVLQQITLRDEQGTVVGQIGELRLVYDPIAILRKRLKIRTAEVVHPQLTLEPAPEGSLNILYLLSPAPPEHAAAPETPPDKGLALALDIDNLHIRDGDLTLHFPALPGAQKLGNVQARLSVQMEKEKLRLQVQQLLAHASPAGLELHALQGTLQRLGQVVQFDDVRVQTDQTTLVANGVLPGGARDASFRLHAQSQGLTEIGRLV